MRERECAAEIHHPKCPCQKCNRRECDGCRVPTDDHFTGKAIGKLLGMSRHQLDRPANHQWLSPPCHQAKDRFTNSELAARRYQMKGHFLGIGDHPDLGYDGDEPHKGRWK